MRKIIQYRDVPLEIRQAISPYLRKYAWLIPDQIHLIDIYYFDKEPPEDNTGDGTSSALTTRTYEEYRRAGIDVYGSYLYGEDYRRETMVLHELIHLHNGPLYSFFQRALDTLLPDEGEESGKLKEVLQTEYTRYLENSTEGLTWALYNHIGVFLSAGNDSAEISYLLEERL